MRNAVSRFPVRILREREWTRRGLGTAMGLGLAEWEWEGTGIRTLPNRPFRSLCTVPCYRVKPQTICVIQTLILCV